MKKESNLNIKFDNEKGIDVIPPKLTV